MKRLIGMVVGFILGFALGRELLSHIEVIEKIVTPPIAVECRTDNLWKSIGVATPPNSPMYFVLTLPTDPPCEQIRLTVPQ